MTTERSELAAYYQEKCDKAYLTPEQAAQVIDFRTDPWWCNADAQADIIIDFFKRQNELVITDFSGLVTEPVR